MNVRVFISLFCLVSLIGCSSTETAEDKRGKVDPVASAQKYFDLGISYMQSGRNDLAESRLQRSIRLNKTPEALNAMALLYEQMKDNLNAETTYEELVSSFPKYSLGYSNYNTFLCKYNRIEQMQQLSERVRAQGTLMAALNEINVGDCAYSKGDLETAKTHYQSALTYEQYAAGALIPLAEIALAQNQPALGKSYIDTLHNYIGQSARSLYVGIMIARRTGDARTEAQYRRDLRARFPNSNEARKLGV